MNTAEALANLDTIISDLQELRSEYERRQMLTGGKHWPEALKAVATVEFSVTLYRNQVDIAIAQGINSVDAGQTIGPGKLDLDEMLANARRMYNGVAQFLNSW